MKEAIQQFWQERSPRERAIISIGSALVVLAMGYFYVWQPIVTGRHRLHTALPGLQSSAQEMRRDEQAVLALKAAGQPLPMSEASFRSALQQSASVLGLNIGQPTSEAANQLKVVMPSVAFDDWIKWVGQLQRRYGIRLERCNIHAQGSPGHVFVAAVFTPEASSP